METDNREISDIDLEKLPTKILKEFRDRADYIIYRRKNKDDTEFPSQLYIYLSEEFFKITRKKYPDYHIYVSIGKNKHISAKLKETSTTLIEYLTSILKHEPDKTTIYKFFKLFATMMVSNIEENLELPLNFTTVLSMADDFPSILDRAFPGYIKAGVIMKVIK
jgi:hypothetical protein